MIALLFATCECMHAWNVERSGCCPSVVHPVAGCLATFRPVRSPGSSPSPTWSDKYCVPDCPMQICKIMKEHLDDVLFVKVSFEVRGFRSCHAIMVARIKGNAWKV